MICLAGLETLVRLMSVPKRVDATRDPIGRSDWQITRDHAWFVPSHQASIATLLDSHSAGAIALVVRTAHAQVPPRVEYRLTEEGESLRPVVAMLSQWGKARLEREQLKASRGATLAESARSA